MEYLPSGLGGRKDLSPQPEKKSAHRRITRTLLVIGLVAMVSMTTANFLGINASSVFQFSTKQALQVSAAYGFGGPNPNAGTLFGGASFPFNLTINNFIGQSTTAFVYFQPTNPGAWSVPGSGSSQNGCQNAGAFTGNYSMTLNGQAIAAQNHPNTFPGQCSPVTGYPQNVDSLQVSVPAGTTTIVGQISVSGNANVGDSFTISWFASTAQPAWSGDPPSLYPTTAPLFCVKGTQGLNDTTTVSCGTVVYTSPTTNVEDWTDPWNGTHVHCTNDTNATPKSICTGLPVTNTTIAVQWGND